LRSSKAALHEEGGNYVLFAQSQTRQHTPILNGLDDVDYFDTALARRSNTTGDRFEGWLICRKTYLSGDLLTPSGIIDGQKCPEFEPCFVTRMRQRTRAETL